MSNVNLEVSTVLMLPPVKRLPSWLPGAWFVRFAQGLATSNPWIPKVSLILLVDNSHLLTLLGDKPFQMVKERLVGTALYIIASISFPVV